MWPFGHVLPALLSPSCMPPLWDGVCKPPPAGLLEPVLPARVLCCFPAPKRPFLTPKHHPFSGETEAHVVEQCWERGCQLK